MSHLPVVNAERFARFAVAYREGLRTAVETRPEDYGYRPEYAGQVADRILATMSSQGIRMVNMDGEGFRLACKALGIKHTRKAITA